MFLLGVEVQGLLLFLTFHAHLHSTAVSVNAGASIRTRCFRLFTLQLCCSHAVMVGEMQEGLDVEERDWDPVSLTRRPSTEVV